LLTVSQKLIRAFLDPKEYYGYWEVILSENPPAQGVDAWFADVRISLLSEWDVLLFLYRRKTSLTSAGQIANLLGYGKSAVGEALDSLVHLGIVRRSRSSQGIRLYDFAVQESFAHQESLHQLLTISDSRSGRLLIARTLQNHRPPMNALERAGLHLARIELKQKEA
jgi:hypothetical protein